MGRSEFLGREGACKHFKVEHKGSSKLGITVLGQPGQVQCDNGQKKHSSLVIILDCMNIFNLKIRRHYYIVFVNKDCNFNFK